MSIFMSDAAADKYNLEWIVQEKSKEVRDHLSYECGIIPNESRIIKIEPKTPPQSPIKVKIEPVTPPQSPIKLLLEPVTPIQSPIKLSIEPVTPIQSPIKTGPVTPPRCTKIPEIFYNRHHQSIKVAHANAKRKYGEALMVINDVLDLEMERNNKYAKLWIYERNRRMLAESKLYDLIHKNI